MVLFCGTFAMVMLKVCAAHGESKPNSPKPVSPKLGFRVRVRVRVRVGVLANRVSANRD